MSKEINENDKAQGRVWLDLDEIKQREYKLLVRFAEFCDARGYKYSLGGGTMLGAIRHKGFIPWDDDIDILMPREDYEKFKQAALDSDSLEITCLENGKSDFPFIKVIDSEVIADFDYIDGGLTRNLWIDIIPMDGMYGDLKKDTKICRKSKRMRFCLEIASSRAGTGTTWYKRIAKDIIRLPFKLYGAKRFARDIDNFCKKYDYKDTGVLGVTVWGYGPQEAVKYEDYLDMVKVAFEGGEFSAMGCYDYYLTDLYGDYMKLPPENERYHHTVSMYLVNE